MKRLNLSIEKSGSSLLTIPEIDLDVDYKIASADVVLIGEGLNLSKLFLSIINTKSKRDKPYNGTISNSIKSEDYKSSKFTFNKPAFALFKDDTNLEIEVYAEPVYVRFSDKHLNSFGVPLFNITGIGGVKFAEIK